MSNTTRQAPIHPHQPRALCSSYHTQWDTNGLYTSTVYLVTYPCAGGGPITPLPPILTPASTQDAPAATPTSTSASASPQTNTASNGWPAGAIALAVCLGLAFTAAMGAAVFFGCRRKKRVVVVRGPGKAEGEYPAPRGEGGLQTVRDPVQGTAQDLVQDQAQGPPPQEGPQGGTVQGPPQVPAQGPAPIPGQWPGSPQTSTLSSASYRSAQEHMRH